MNILLINQAFVGPKEPGHTRHYELGCYLNQHGDSLTIIASNLNYQTGQRTTEGRGLVEEQNIDGIRVLRTYILPTLHRSFLWRIISFISFALTSVWAALRAGPVDIVLGTTPPIFQAASAWFVAAIRRRPFLLEVRDLWPEFAIDMGILKNPILIKLSRGLEQFLYKRATHIVVNSPAYCDYLLKKGVPQSKISFVPYGTDTNMFNPNIDGIPLRQELGVNDKFVVVYAGALGLANDIYTLLRCAQHLQSHKSIQFVLFGDGKERPMLEEKARELQLRNVMFAGTRPKSMMPTVLAAADACLAILQDIPMFSTTYPNKVFDYMAAGRPTILAIDGVIKDVIEDAKAGIFVTPGDDKALAEAVLHLSQNKELVHSMAAAARTYVVDHFDREQRMAEFVTLLHQVKEGKGKK